MTRQPPEAAKSDSPEAVAALDEAYDFLAMIGRRVRAEQAREAAERQSEPPEPTTTTAG